MTQLKEKEDKSSLSFPARVNPVSALMHWITDKKERSNIKSMDAALLWASSRWKTHSLVTYRPWLLSGHAGVTSSAAMTANVGTNVCLSLLSRGEKSIRHLQFMILLVAYMNRWSYECTSRFGSNCSGMNCVCVWDQLCQSTPRARGWPLLMHEVAVFQLITDFICHMRSLLRYVCLLEPCCGGCWWWGVGWVEGEGQVAPSCEAACVFCSPEYICNFISEHFQFSQHLSAQYARTNSFLSGGFM